MKQKSGIYRIINIVNNKGYVGKAIRLHTREVEHFRFLKNNTHHSQYLQRAYNEYGVGNFIFEILEYVDDITKLFEREQYWIDFYDAANPDKGYNIYPFSIGPLGIEREQTKKNKLSILNFCKTYGYRPSRISKNKQESKLGELLESYAKKISTTYDPEFRETILVYPSKRNYNQNQVKQEILNFIKIKGYLPSRDSTDIMQKKLGKILSYIRLRNNILYDPSFVSLLCNVPTFKQFNTIKYKNKLKKFVKEKGYIPSSKSKDKNERYLGKAWYHFSDENRKCYDSELVGFVSSFPTFRNSKKVLI